jgi:hypothetical protein
VSKEEAGEPNEVRIKMNDALENFEEFSIDKDLFSIGSGFENSWYFITQSSEVYTANFGD